MTGHGDPYNNEDGAKDVCDEYARDHLAITWNRASRDGSHSAKPPRVP